eukprot:287938-Rhodomonas_salina.4
MFLRLAPAVLPVRYGPFSTDVGYAATRRWTTGRRSWVSRLLQCPVSGSILCFGDAVRGTDACCALFELDLSDLSSYV